MGRLVIYFSALVVFIVLAGAALSLSATLLWASWNNSAAHVSGVGAVGWSEALWFVLLALVLRGLLFPLNLVSQTKSSKIQ